MKIPIPVITHDLPLADYSPEMGEAVLKVWVNPPRAFQAELNRPPAPKAIAPRPTKRLARAAQQAAQQAAKEQSDGAANDEWALGWYSKLLSQHPDPETHMSPDDLRVIWEADPALSNFITVRSWDMLNAYQAEMVKKAVMRSKLDQPLIP